MGDKVYHQWRTLYETDKCEQFYLGHQKDAKNDEQYIVNLTFANVEIRVPSMMFYRPNVIITPKPGRDDDAGTLIEERAELLEDTGQSLVEDSRVGFQNSAIRCVREAFFRFGVMYIGYEQRDFIDNPFLGKPPAPDDSAITAVLKREDAPKQLPKSDGIFCRRIPARQFRVSHNSHNDLEENDWVGFYTWEYPSDIERNPSYSNTKGFRSNKQFNLNPGVTGEASNAGVGYDQQDKDQAQKGLVKVWHIWDCRQKLRFDFPDAGDRFFIDGKEWIKSVSGRPILPFEDLMFYPILDEYYPVPVLFNWLDPQREINDDREMKRIHRRKAARRYTMAPGSITTDQLDGLMHGEDMTVVEAQGQQVGGPSPLVPVPDVPLDRNLYMQSAVTERDFNMVSGTPSEDRGIASAETATQASIINTAGQIRESYGREQVAGFLGRCIKKMLEIARAKLQYSFVIKRNVDPVSMGKMLEEARVKAIWKTIRASDLGDIDFDCAVDVEALSPANSEERFKKWMQLMSMLPQMMPILAKSDYMLKKTFDGFGVRSWRDRSEMKKAFMELVAEQAQQMQQQLAAKGGGASAPTGAAPSPAAGPMPAQATIAQNIEAQMAQAAGVGQSGRPH